MCGVSRLISRSPASFFNIVSLMVSSYWQSALPARLNQVCRYRSTRLTSCRRRRPSRISRSLDGLELCVGGREELVQASELAHDRLDDELRNARDRPEDAVAPRGHGVVQSVDLALVPEQLREPPEVEEVLVWQPRHRVHDERETLLRVVRQVVVHERRLRAGHAHHRLLELQIG